MKAKIRNVNNRKSINKSRSKNEIRSKSEISKDMRKRISVDKNIRRKKKFLTVGLGLILPLLLLYFFVGSDMKDYIYFNIMTNAPDITDSNADDDIIIDDDINTDDDNNADNENDVIEDEDAIDVADDSEMEDGFDVQVKSYYLTLVGRNGITDTIYGQEINLHTESADYIPDLIEKQNGLTWLLSLFHLKELKTKPKLEYDDTLLRNIIKNLNYYDEANIEEPRNASITKNSKNSYEIVPESQGAMVNENKLYEAIHNSIISLKTSLSLEEAGCYLEPEIKATSTEVITAFNEMNRIVSAKITYEFGEATEVLNSTEISNWISVDQDFKVHIDAKAVKEYVDYLGKTYNTFGRVREFTTSYGNVINIKGGDYGWWLDRPAEVSELTKLLRNGEQLIKKPVYIQTAQQYGLDDVGDTYVEVNITAQHLFFYKEGELIVETDFVSGNLSKDYGTPSGTFPVQYKDNDATLVGEDYATPVKYWMPFNRNIGFHDAYWRDEFGKDIYLTKGSHGCINMPPAAAEIMFKHIKRGVAVVVYELEGTENYELKEDIEN